MAKRGAVLLGMLAALLLISAGPASAGPVTIQDESHVLDAGRVKDAANAVPDPVQIFTTERLADNNAAFDQEAQSHVTAPNDVVIAINTKSRHLAIRTGANSHIRDASPAIAAFKNGFGTGNDYNGATIGALNSLAQAANQAAPAPSRANRPVPQAKPSQHSSGFSLWSVLCPLVIIALIVLAVVAVFRRRGRGGGGGGGNPPPGNYGPGGYGPGGADPGYDPGYGQRRGMSPGMAGGLGAAAGAVGGGLLGYELGRMEGRGEEQHVQGFDQPAPDAGYDQSPQQWGGGGGDADFGSDDGGSDGGSDGGFDSGGGGDGGGSGNF
ncbi:hypothetical protein [Nocardia sp. NPDC051570]|uniref:hypothetical protein n=1 Tax=Nocardia sp. NPDC051570 TaxID=3364324 RepID=UPI0037B8C145